jgi:hypothetical protein
MASHPSDRLDVGGSGAPPYHQLGPQQVLRGGLRAVEVQDQDLDRIVSHQNHLIGTLFWQTRVTTFAIRKKQLTLFILSLDIYFEKCTVLVIIAIPFVFVNQEGAILYGYFKKA